MHFKQRKLDETVDQEMIYFGQVGEEMMRNEKALEMNHAFHLPYEVEFRRCTQDRKKTFSILY